jgi:hypothetical protein
VVNVSGSLVAKYSSAPSRSPSSCFFSDWDSTVTSAPMAEASLTAMCPSPPRPTTATRLPGPAPQRRSGEYVVMPAHSSGAAAAGSMPSGTRSTKPASTTTCVE